MFKTELTEKLGIEYPIIQAGMGGLATAELVAAVSNAGGLGVIGAAMMTPAILREQVRKVKDLTDKPFGVDLLLAQHWPGLEEMIQVMLEEEVPVFASGLGNPAPYAEEMHRHDMTVMAVIAAALGPLGDDDVRAALDHPVGVADGADHGHYRHAVSVHLLSVGGRVAQAGGEHGHLLLEHDLDHLVQSGPALGQKEVDAEGLVG